MKDKKREIYNKLKENPKNVRFTDLCKAAELFGFKYRGGKGSHVVLYKIDENGKRLVIVPKRKEIPRGTLLSILKQANLSKEEFIDLLD